MGRKRAFKRGRWVPILVAGGIGYLLGSWHVTALRSTEPSASQKVALRFPQDWDAAQAGDAVRAAASASAATASAMVVGDTQFALLSPEPMVHSIAVAPAPVQTASLEVDASPAPDAAPQPSAAAEHARETKPAPSAGEAKSAAAASRRHAERPGFVLNDAQIASIKERLNLTPDQERMWPAVEVALRNIAYTNAREAHRRGAGAGATQLAAAAPNSAEVQDLKSAAIPLLMSFNAEQKDQVRSLAHVMGLDQLTSQF